ncbi:MAG: efflux RND transporter periplasmic adaptor subunit [Patescibacteria group bacterium]
MKLFKNKWFWITIVAIVVIVGIWFAVKPKDTVEIITDTVKSGTLRQTVEASGELESIDQVELSFDSSGTVDEIYFEKGDQVEVGDLLAKLTADDLEADVAQARQNVSIAQARLDLERAGATTESIQIAEAQVEIAEATLEGAQSNLDNANEDLTNVRRVYNADVNEKEISYETKQDTLVNVLADNEQDIKPAQEDLVSTMKSNMISIRSALSKTDEVLGRTNPLLNQDFNEILGHQDPTAVSNANNSYDHAVESRDEAEDLVFVLTTDSEYEAIETAADAVDQAFYDAGNALLYTRQALDGTTLETNDFYTADLLALKTSIDTSRNDVQLEESAFITDRQYLASVMISAGAAEVDATHAVDAAAQLLASAQANRDRQISSAQSAIRTAEADVNIKNADLTRTKASLAQVVADPRSVDVAGLIAEVNRASSALDSAEARLAKATIVSPINGIVSKIEIEEGEQISGLKPVIVVQTTTDDQFRITADIPESDITKVSVNDKVDVTFDAFGDDVHFKGTLRKIDPAENAVEGVVYYKVDIYLDEQSEEFKPGLSADVVIMTEEIMETLYIPQRAVLERDGYKYVRIPRGKKYDEQPVEIGIRGDDGFVQILAGLEEGQEIVVSIRE